jgi:hypothetical protein
VQPDSLRSSRNAQLQGSPRALDGLLARLDTPRAAELVAGVDRWIRHYASRDPRAAVEVAQRYGTKEAHEERMADLERRAAEWFAAERTAAESGLAASAERVRRAAYMEEVPDGTSLDRSTPHGSRQWDGSSRAALERRRAILGRGPGGYDRVDLIIQASLLSRSRMLVETPEQLVGLEMTLADRIALLDEEADLWMELHGRVGAMVDAATAVTNVRELGLRALTLAPQPSREDRSLGEDRTTQSRLWRRPDEHERQPTADREAREQATAPIERALPRDDGGYGY